MNMVKKFESINMVELAVKAEKKAMEKIIGKESNMEKLEHLKKEIEILQKKCLDIFNPNMMSDLEQLIFKRKQANYILTNKRKGK